MHEHEISGIGFRVSGLGTDMSIQVCPVYGVWVADVLCAVYSFTTAVGDVCVAYFDSVYASPVSLALCRLGE